MVKRYGIVSGNHPQGEFLSENAYGCVVLWTDYVALAARLADALAELDKRVFAKGSTPPFAHIEYCGLCHYSREWIAQHGHGESCLLRNAVSADEVQR